MDVGLGQQELDRAVARAIVHHKEARDAQGTVMAKIVRQPQGFVAHHQEGADFSAALRNRPMVEALKRGVRAHQEG